MLDRLKPWQRHLVALAGLGPLGTFLLVPTAAVVTAGGVLDVDWPAQLRIAVDAAAVTLAGGVTALVALYITPLTRRYGVGADTTRKD